MYKLLILTTLVAAALARTPPKLTCFKSGAGPASTCEQFICDFCKGAARNQFSNGESTGACYNVGGRQRCIFTAFNSGNSTGAPNEAACNVALWTASESCQLGGTAQMDWSPGLTTYGVEFSNTHCAMGA